MSEKVVVSVKEGQIKGIKQSSKFSGTEYYSFLGIPYGKAPVNALRFKDPVKSKPWSNVLDATTEKIGCVQFSLHTCEFMGTEDCLFNNVHIPKLPRKNDTLRPVIVNIHPGALKHGSPHTQIYGSPEFIMHHDVVYVGFLNLELKECSGNQGIKDIVLSLRWINDNIRSFGGDPENITLIGSSSGASIVHILMLSPSAKGLFHKAVLMGSYLQKPNLYCPENNKNHAQQVAEFLGYNKNLQDAKQMLSFLKKQDPILLIQACRVAQMDSLKGFAKTNVCVPLTGVFCNSLDRGDILPEWSGKSIESMARIPVMIGFSQIESAVSFLPTFREATLKNFKYLLRQNFFGWGYHLSDSDVDSIDEEVKAFYYNEQSYHEVPLRLKMDIQTDVWLSDVYDAVINPISTDLPSSVFVYKFEFEGNIFSFNSSVKDSLGEAIKGTIHATDFSYWNHMGDPQDRRTREMVETFTTLVTTFARTGDPNYENFPAKWRPSTPDKPCYLSMNDQFVMIDDKLNNGASEFWDNIKKKYHAIPKDE